MNITFNTAIKLKRSLLYFICLVLLISYACKPAPTPRPRGYFKIEFPEKEYQLFDTNCPYSFEYPVYGNIEAFSGKVEVPCWYNIDFPKHKAKVHLTYKELDNNLAIHIEDVRTIVYKHTVKADDIIEELVLDYENKVYGIIYRLVGNTASTSTFFLTDSTKNFLTGSLYFSAIPNKDSLAPAIKFFHEDVVHLTKTLKWK